MIKDTNPDHYKVDDANFVEYMNDPKVGGFGNWMFANGYNSGVWASSNWISVKDRLPELEGDYLVTDGHYVPWKCRLLILAGVKGWANGIYNPLIKYWMPMPELPKDGEVGCG